MFRIAAGNGMVLQFAETPRKRNMLGARDVLIAQEQHPVLEQRRTDLGEQTVVVDRIGKIHADQFGADAVRQLVDLHGVFLK
jgi:hypothetical protein